MADDLRVSRCFLECGEEELRSAHARDRDLSFGGLAECETANSTGPEYMIGKKLLDESEFPVM